MGLPLHHVLQLRPLTGAALEVGGDLEEEEVLEAGVGPQLGEQEGLLKEAEQEVLRKKPYSSLPSSPPLPAGGPPLRGHWRVTCIGDPALTFHVLWLAGLLPVGGTAASVRPLRAGLPSFLGAQVRRYRGQGRQGQ